MSNFPHQRTSESERDPPSSGDAQFSLLTYISQSNGNEFPFLDPPEREGELGRIHNYRIKRLIGTGGMGFVFEAVDTLLNRPIAVKVMKPDLAAQLKARDRFLSEARAAAGLRSDYVVTIYQVGQINGLPYLAMELLEGQSLHDRLRQVAQLPVDQAVRIGMEAARGVAAAHDAGLVHRDIKPANLWLESDPTGRDFKRVRVLDFGLARSFDGSPGLTTAGTVVGTPHFMAPEQADGQQVDGRADVFSLGCVLYTMLTGDMPFRGSGTMAVMMALANHDPTPPRTLNPNVPPALDALVLRMMAKRPEERPATAAAVAEILGFIAQGMSSTHNAMPAGSPPTPYPESADTKKFDWADGGEMLSTPQMPTPQRSSRLNELPSGANDGRLAPRQAAAIVGIVLAGAFLAFAFFPRGSDTPPVLPAASPDPIVVGVLHSTSGPMATVGAPVTDATLMAIDEVNAAGGVLGRPIKPVVIDGKSDPLTFAEAAERLLTAEGAAALFGCGSSASRKTVRPVVERFQGVLFYPVHHEGLEESPRIVYLGPAPNQQLFTALEYLIGQGKRRIFFVGSDFVFPRAAAEITRDALAERSDGQVSLVGEYFLPIGARDVSETITAIQLAKPDAIVNAVTGATNGPLFRSLKEAGPPIADVPVLSVSLMEPDLERIDPKAALGHFVTGGYFRSQELPSWKAFAQKVSERYGADRAVSDPMAAAYTGVHLWADAANDVRSVNPDEVLKAVAGRTRAAPWGELRIDPETLYSWLPAQVGKIEPSSAGRLHISPVAGMPEPIRPVPYPPTRPRSDWDRLLTELFDDWGGNWQAPPASR